MCSNNTQACFNVVKNLSETLENCTYSYRIIENPFITDGGITISAYGIEVEKIGMNGQEINNIERDSVEYISPALYKVNSLLSLLYNNNVSPVHLVDVIGEYVDEYVEDFD